MIRALFLTGLTIFISACNFNKPIDEVELMIVPTGSKLHLSIKNNLDNDVIILSVASTPTPYYTYHAFKKCSGEILELSTASEEGWWTPLSLVSQIYPQKEYTLKAHAIASVEIDATNMRDLIYGKVTDPICEYNLAIETFTKSGEIYRKELGWTPIKSAENLSK